MLLLASPGSSREPGGGRHQLGGVMNQARSYVGFMCQQEELGRAKRSQGTRKKQEEPGGARRIHKEPAGFRRSQEELGGART